MSRISHHSRAELPRHRLWLGLAFLVVAAIAGLVAAEWLVQTPMPTHSGPVAVALPPAQNAKIQSAEKGAPNSAPGAAPAVPPMAEAIAPAPAVPPNEPLSPSRNSAETPQAAPAMPSAPAPSEREPAWLRFATTAVVERDKPMVAIVIDDLGLDHPRTERALELPAAVTMSFLPYAADLLAVTAAARGKGHELIVHVPMQPMNTHIDMGPNGLATGLPRAEVLRRLDWDLDRFPGYVGINNHMGSRFTADAQGMQWVMEELKSRGLMFLDSRTIAGSVGAKAAAVMGVPYTARDVFLDDDQSAPAVQQQLRIVETIARKHGSVVAIGHPHDATLAILSAWIASLPQKGLVLVPLTEIVKAQLKIG